MINPICTLHQGQIVAVEKVDLVAEAGNVLTLKDMKHLVLTFVIYQA